MASVFFYVSGHGFGHASRQIEVVNAFSALDGGATRVVIRSPAARWLFERTVAAPFTLIDEPVDADVVQVDSLQLEERATVRQAEEFYETLNPRARREAALLREHDARLVICDAPPLGCAAAAAAGVPSVVCANFTWDWIYEAYGPPADVILRIREAYAKAEAGWRLPMHGGFERFAHVVDVPFVARHARRDRSASEVRRELGLPLHQRVALVSFGGCGVHDLPLDRLDCIGPPDGWTVVLVAEDELPAVPHGIYGISHARLEACALRYEDVVAAADVVVTKPGYGIVSECIANDTAILYTSRGHFVEYDVLVREMPRYVRCRFIPQEALFAGKWREGLERLLEQPTAPERAATNGAEVIAGMIRRYTA